MPTLATCSHTEGRFVDFKELLEAAVRNAVRDAVRGLGERKEPVAPVAPSADGLWTAAEVAAFLRVSRSWVYKRAEAGDLPHQRIGGLLRFEPERIREYARGERQGKVIPFVKGA